MRQTAHDHGPGMPGPYRNASLFARYALGFGAACGGDACVARGRAPSNAK